MAWVVVDKNGKEYIYHEKPDRGDECFDPFGLLYCFALPKGSIKKLIGKDLTWEDNPVELKEE